MAELSPSKNVLAAVPLFPLPNVVLFPRAVLPLHIFEQRYKEMTADALNGSRQVAMALLRPGWEKSYHQKRAPIEPIVCVGEIVTHEKLADGEYNFLLQGHTRARIVREFGEQPYRLAELQRLEESPALEIDLDAHREQLSQLLAEEAYALLPGRRQFRQMLTSPLPTPDIADLLAFHVLEDVWLKQSLLTDADVRRRVGRVVQALVGLRPTLEALKKAPAAVARVRFPADPGLN